MFATLMLCIGIGIGGVLVYFATPTPSPSVQVVEARCVGNAEVSDLIERLRPLAKNPNEAWYSSGINVMFSGGDVRVILKTRDGNEYNGHAATLKDAVARITDPSSTIRVALEGWGKP